MRALRPGNSTVFKFLPYDDNSIGVEKDTITEKYQEYLRTAKLSVLQIDKEAKPSFYWLKPLNDTLWQKVRFLFDSAKSTEVPEELDDASIVSMELIHAEIVRECLIGADYHPQVIGVGDEGELLIKEWKWKIGDKEPEGLKDLIMSDLALTHAMFQFIISVSILTETEKKV